MPASEPDLPRALLLTAGLGTRLQPLTYLRAKAAVPINGEALVRRVMRWLAGAGVRDLVLNLHHLPKSISAVVGDGSDLDVRVRYSWEQPILGSAGGPRRALPLLADADDDSFLIVNGDTLTDLNVASLLERHRTSGALVTMALIENPRPETYGGVLVSDGWVTGFTRAQKSGGAAARNYHSYHFIGVQAARARAFADLEDGVRFESVNSLYPRLMAHDPKSIAAHISRSTFLDLGSPGDYLITALELAAVEGNRLTGNRIAIHNSAVLSRTVLWDDVTVGPEAHLYECIVGDGVAIPVGARYERCAIVPGAGRSPQSDERLDDDLLIKRF
jgi:NDP-sugar pyrophosphorylase family protein